MKTATIKNIARIILGAFMVLAAIGHFTFQRQEFQAQVPNWLGNKDLIVILSGIVELMLGLGMIFGRKFKVYIGIMLALFYVAIFPGNIAQYLNHTNAFGLDTDTARLIRLFFQPVLILWALWSTDALKFYLERAKPVPGKNNFFDFEANDIKGRPVAMEQYRGKYIVVVNTATQCGLAPQLEYLEKMHRLYNDKGLVILGFPSNQFAEQEPGNNDQIAEACAINYGVSFKMFGKIDVNGENAHPIFRYLRNKLPDRIGDGIKWNFTKFVIGPDGKPLKRFAPRTTPDKVEEYVKPLLGN